MSLLSQPIRIGTMTVKNRMVMPPMNTNFSNESGAVTPQMTEYYAARAKGGAGLIIVEATGVDPLVRNHGAQPMIVKSHISGWSTLVEKLHRYDVKVAMEVVHHASEARYGPKVSASDVSSFKGIPVKPLSIEEIGQVEDIFAETVFNIKTAGFDAAVLHGAHGYLIAHFLSPIYNKRTDEYGGSLENRMRFLNEIIRKCRARVGSFPLTVRISADEFIEGGRTFEETKQIAVMLEKEGIDAIDISAGVSTSYYFCIRPYSYPLEPGYLSEYTRQLKELVSIPVITVGGIRTAQEAEQILAEGKADLVALGRTLIADPDFCVKALEGRDADIRKCLSCQHCMSTIVMDLPMKCTVNPEAGREFEFAPLKKADEEKKVCVVGAGPAGLEAARVAALRGHDVTLYEKTGALGGTMIPAAAPPNKECIGDLIGWYEKQLRDLDVLVKLNTEWNAAEADKNPPDVLVFAAGADYARFIPGSEGALDAVTAIMNPEKVSGRIVIIGGGSSGCEAAEFFAGERVTADKLRVKDFSGEIEYTTRTNPDVPQRDITIIEMLDDICTDMEFFNRTSMLIALKENGVKVLTNMKVKNIGGGAVEIENTKTGACQSVGADTVVLAGGLKPRPLPGMPARGMQVIRIGDSRQPGRIMDAIYNGHYIAREI